MSGFHFESMDDKYKVFTGKEWIADGQNDGTYIRKSFPTVSLEYNTKLLDDMHLVRDWCEEHFGNNWIYDWNDFYFINEKDATFFALRWS